MAGNQGSSSTTAPAPAAIRLNSLVAFVTVSPGISSTVMVNSWASPFYNAHENLQPTKMAINLERFEIDIINEVRGIIKTIRLSDIRKVTLHNDNSATGAAPLSMKIEMELVDVGGEFVITLINPDQANCVTEAFKLFSEQLDLETGFRSMA